MDTADFLKEVYRLAEAGNEDECAQRIMGYMDDAQRAGKFDICCRVFRLVDVVRLRQWPSLLLDFLLITFAAARQNLVPDRHEFAQRVRVVLVEDLGESRAVQLIDRWALDLK